MPLEPTLHGCLPPTTPRAFATTARPRAMRLERGQGEDRATALVLLARGAALGDARSRARLGQERARN